MRRTAAPAGRAAHPAVESAPEPARPVGALAMQQQAGNRATTRLLGPGTSLSRPGDPAEAHARRTAERVLGMPPPAASVARTAMPTAGGGGVAGGTEGGRPLGPDVRAFFEPRMGVDLSTVRVHTGPRAAHSAASLGARAFTRGRDVAFGEGMYQPGTAAGRRLLAHELTHVLQHAGVAGPAPVPGRIYRDPDTRPAPKTCMEQTDDILPGQVGLLTAIHREQQLAEIFGDGVDTLKAEIRADRAAREFVCYAGVPAIVALAETRKGAAFDVPAARELLKKQPERFSAAALARRPPETRRLQELRMREARDAMESTGRWARSEARKPGVPSMTGVVGLPQERRDEMAGALTRLNASAASFASAKTAIAAVDPLIVTVAKQIDEAKGKVREERGPELARAKLGDAVDSVDPVVNALRVVNAHHDVAQLRADAEALGASIETFRRGLRRDAEVDTDGFRTLRDAARDLRKAVAQRKRKLDAAPASLERLRFVLRYFLALNDPAFRDPPTDAEAERLGGRLDEIGPDLEVLFGSRMGVSDLELVEALAHRFRDQLAVRADMQATTGTRPGQVPAVADVRSYFTSLRTAPNDRVIEAYQKYASAFYEHQAVSSTQDLDVLGMDTLFTRPVSIGGTRGLVCTGYAILGAGLLELAGGHVEGFVVAVRASPAQRASGGALSDAHAIARVRRNGTLMIVSNHLIVFDENDAIGPDAVAWTDKDNPLFRGTGPTIRAATTAVQQKLVVP
jgi:hypothetical protein